MSESYDYIIVGAGTSGCVLARRLSEHASVLLLEAGPPDASPDIHDPEGVVRTIFFDAGISVPYGSEPQAHLTEPHASRRGRVVPVHRGVVRGGCSSIHGMIHVRGNRRNYDHWAELGNEGWGYDDVLPYFKSLEDHEAGASTFRGAGGPLHVRAIPDPSPLSHAFIDAAASLGPFPGSRSDADVNGAQQEDIAAHCDVQLTPDGRRASAAVAFLDPVADRDKLTVRTGVRVSRVLIEGGRAVGVEARDGNGSATRYHAGGEVILSAGAFESPKLLMLSGIGPADHLREHGIAPVQDLPGVGGNLQDHMMMLLYVLAGSGANPGVSRFITEALLFTDTRDGGDATPDLQYHVLAGMHGLAFDPTTDPYFIMCPTVIQPESRGTVRLRSSDPAALPRVEPGYLERSADVEVLVRGIELARELSNTAPMSEFSGGNPFFAIVLHPDDPFNKPPVQLTVPATGRDGLDDFVRACATTTWHPVGTCAMGRDENAVVDPELRVLGVEGLRVVDVSVMPKITSGNTSAPAMMIGERAADLIRA